MRRTKTMILIGVIAAFGLTFGPAALGSNHVIAEPDSERLNFFPELPSEYPADTAFHIRHGWGVVPGELGVALKDYNFHLFVDGYQETPDFVGCIDATQGESPPSPPCRSFLYDFPEGLSEGTYEFTGVWIAPCGAFLDAQFNTWNSCVDPTEPMTHPNLVRSFHVTFTGGE